MAARLLKLLCRAGDFHFAELQLTAHEQRVLDAFAPSTERIAKGYLAWRRTLIAPMAVLLSLATMLSICIVVATYAPGQKDFLERLVGPELWIKIFCPTEHPCSSHTAGLESVYAVLLLTDALLALVSVVSCVLLLLASRQWASYARSAARVRYA